MQREVIRNSMLGVGFSQVEGGISSNVMRLQVLDFMTSLLLHQKISEVLIYLISVSKADCRVRQANEMSAKSLDTAPKGQHRMSSGDPPAAAFHRQAQISRTCPS